MEGFEARAGRVRWVLTAVFLSALAPVLAQSETEPAFELSFSPCPAEITAAPGTSAARVFDVVVTTSKNPMPSVGAAGWSISVSSDFLTLTGITTAGTAAAPETDSPPGLRRNGFEKSEVATQHNSGDCEGRVGAISAVVLSFLEVVTLPPSGPSTIAKVTVSGTAPAVTGDRAPASLIFVNGCGGAG